MLPSISVLMDSNGRDGRSSPAGWHCLVEGFRLIEGMYLEATTPPNALPPKRLKAFDPPSLVKGSNVREVTEGRTNLK